jgi:hypothetical protein
VWTNEITKTIDTCYEQVGRRGKKEGKKERNKERKEERKKEKT